VQHLENFSSRAIYHRGWWACARRDQEPWDLWPQVLLRFAPRNYDPDNNLVAERPDQVTELTRLWWPKPNEPGNCRCRAGSPQCWAACRRFPPPPGSPSKATYKTFSEAWSPRIFGRSWAIGARL